MSKMIRKPKCEECNKILKRMSVRKRNKSTSTPFFMCENCVEVSQPLIVFAMNHEFDYNEDKKVVQLIIEYSTENYEKRSKQDLNDILKDKSADLIRDWVTNNFSRQLLMKREIKVLDLLSKISTDIKNAFKSYLDKQLTKKSSKDLASINKKYKFNDTAVFLESLSQFMENSKKDRAGKEMIEMHTTIKKQLKTWEGEERLNFNSNNIHLETFTDNQYSVSYNFD